MDYGEQNLSAKIRDAICAGRARRKEESVKRIRRRVFEAEWKLKEALLTLVIQAERRAGACSVCVCVCVYVFGRCGGQ
jgi:hypothetical protein